MENHVKDEQIQRQSETIASLERKVESLERELEKFLDPDSGTISPKFKPSSGEAALLEQIASLQKQLDKCLEKDQLVIIRTPYIYKTLATACAAPFMPHWELAEDGSGRVFYPKHSLWERLQTELLGDNLKDYWTHKAFKRASRYVNYITNKLVIQNIAGLKTEQYESAAEDIGDHCYWVDDEDPEQHAAFLLLKEMVEKIKANGWMSYHKIDDLLISITVIAQCQAIYLSCQDEPEPVEEEKEAEQEAE